MKHLSAALRHRGDTPWCTRDALASVRYSLGRIHLKVVHVDMSLPWASLYPRLWLSNNPLWASGSEYTHSLQPQVNPCTEGTTFVSIQVPSAVHATTRRASRLHCPFTHLYSTPTGSGGPHCHPPSRVLTLHWAYQDLTFRVEWRNLTPEFQARPCTTVGGTNSAR